MRVLVCGGRTYQGDVSCLDMIKITILIHGEADGADTRSAKYVMAKGIHAAGVPALWDVYRKGAGHERNEAMLLLNPQYCVAFPGGVGTATMVGLATDMGIPVWRPYGY